MRDIDDFMGLLGSFGLLDDLPFFEQEANAERCLTCQYHPTILKLRPEEEGQHCYMFKDFPETLCMQYKQSYSLSAIAASDTSPKKS